MLSVVKLILTALVIVVLLAGCGKIYDLTKGNDPGSVKSFNSLVDTIEFMGKNEKSENPIDLNDFYLASDYFIVGFGKDDEVVNGIGRNFRCSDKLSCVVLCKDDCENVLDYYVSEFDIGQFSFLETSGLVSVSVFKDGDKFEIRGV